MRILSVKDAQGGGILIKVKDMPLPTYMGQELSQNGNTWTIISLFFSPSNSRPEKYDITKMRLEFKSGYEHAIPVVGRAKVLNRTFKAHYPD